MTAREYVSNGSLVALHFIHHVRIAVQHFNHWHWRVVSDRHEADFSLNLKERVKVVTIKRNKDGVLDHKAIENVNLPADFELLYCSFLWPNRLKMLFFQTRVRIGDPSPDCFGLLAIQLMRVQIALKRSTDGNIIIHKSTLTV